MCYLPEPGSDEFNRTVEGRVDLLVSDLVVTEVVSALARRLRQGAPTREVARRVQHAIVGRLDDGVYRRRPWRPWRLPLSGVVAGAKIGRVPR